MTTFNISAGDVNGLVAAIKFANANSEPDIIELAAGVYDASAYSCTDRTTDLFFIEDGLLAANAFPVIRSEITINGAGAATTLITREGTDTLRLFAVAGEGTLRLSDVTLRKGDVGEADTGGGAVYNQGVFETERSVFKASKAGYGGAIRNDGTAQITDSQISESLSVWGGGLYNTGTMTVETSLISDNEAPDGGGIINYGALTVQGSIIAANRSMYGGGIGNYGGSSAVSGSTISHNNASEGGGGLYNRIGEMSVQGSSIVNNTSPAGNAVLNEDLTTTIDAEMNWWGSADGPGVDDVAGLVSTADYQTTEPESQGYWYNRQGVSLRATLTSKKNFEHFATSIKGDVRNSDNETFDPDREQFEFDEVLYSSVGGRFWYKASDVLAHESGDLTSNSTGSSIFVSEMVHLGGGIPMLIGSDEEPSCDTAAHDTNATPLQVGWRACVYDAKLYCAVDLATNTWKDHESLHGYFSAMNGGPVQALLTMDTLDRDDRMNFVDYAGTLSWGTLADFQAHVYGIFNGTDVETPDNLELIQTGDYIYLYLGEDGVSHGFLIVGWGPAVECPSGLNSPIVASVDTSSSEGQYQLRRIPDTVPYVVDFCYAYNSDASATGWLQDPRPRPFYCSAALMETPRNDDMLSPHLTRLGASSVDDYLAKLRGSYQPFNIKVDGNPPQYLTPDWLFIRLPDMLQAAHGIYPSCS